ncbi:hypothetical protein AOQ84DRAFT_346868 [Glonium stellatum]|uniref:Zn(2)-C6 fungal-type domain-containing protein n=1 Tax=Glonium stellatum TaxID=574774 RepID=A0A8E2ESC7_9PEZI|nr:hypothetical protein AOQ84DRAFT_346868 [Glonium stellatum]
MEDQVPKPTSKRRDSSEATDPPNKRRRIALACSACRTRKSRCDGARPRCTLCTDLGFECVYVQSASSANVIVGKEYLSQLEDRVQSIEETLNVFREHITTLSQTARVVEIIPRSESDGTIVENAQLQEVTNEQDAVDGMGAAVFANEEESGFFGPSSNIAFLRRISRAVAHTVNSDQPWTPLTGPDSAHFDGGFMSVSRPSSPSRQSKPEEQINIYALPPESQTLSIIKRYFSDTGFLYPFLHEESFVQTYMQMRRKHPSGVRKSWLGLLNIVLALTTSTTVDDGLKSETRITESNIFYQRAMGLCFNQIMRGTSLEIVQYLLVMGLFLQGTQKSIQAWTAHGLAVKAAFQLGLHSKEASRSFPPLERELRKRAWYGCIILDRTLSMTFGRPATIPESYVKLELPEPFENPSSSPAEYSHKQDSVGFFSATIKLYKVMWSIIDSLYGQNISCDQSSRVEDTIPRLFNIERELSDWERALPQNLRLQSSQDVLVNTTGTAANGNIRCESRLVTILTLRYLNVRLLLHRPILIKFLDTSGKTDEDSHELTMLQQIGSNSIQISMQSAIDIIGIVHAAVHAAGRKGGLLGAWWFSLYYTFNAALVLFGCLLVCRTANKTALTTLPTKDSAKMSLEKAVEALEILDHGNRMVKLRNRRKGLCNKLGQAIQAPIAGPRLPAPVCSNHL